MKGPRAGGNDCFEGGSCRNLEVGEKEERANLGFYQNLTKKKNWI